MVNSTPEHQKNPGNQILMCLLFVSQFLSDLGATLDRMLRRVASQPNSCKISCNINDVNQNTFKFRKKPKLKKISPFINMTVS